ncbi:PilZ domain-containing protein [Methylobacterium nonmethylotrophicum]|uniref:Pilus assembly protein PilZ n=1 Tax=Methylobacterium nonmethylotrophicum TaxID=1141884 RepID=A0A4Z0NTR4_9HYPH|nr:PilZ domain-containing protein [Methylobacterium nonmethylotrophicum]TGD99855.1 pilus assembly protein PilZ [Methylobacterium nonmethylotrophicum]
MIVADALKLHIQPEPEPGTRPIQIRVSGRYLLPGGVEHACETRSLSLSAIEVLAPESGLLGDPVTLYLDDVGPVAGAIRSISSDGFTLAVEVGPERRARFAARLDWLAGQASGRADQRSDPRIVPTQRAVEVRRADGQVLPGTVIDISMSGAAIAVDDKPAVGEAVTVGKRRATVVRHLETGFAVTFRLPFRPETFGRHVVL